MEIAREFKIDENGGLIRDRNTEPINPVANFQIRKLRDDSIGLR